MLSVKEWLASLGLSEYADRFAEHRIDFSILRDLTDQDLKEELGVVLFGVRRRLLRAIAPACRSRLRHAPACAWVRIEPPGRCRAPPSHGDVRGPGRFDRAFHPHGPRGLARDHFGLSEMRRRDRAPPRRVRR